MARKLDRALLPQGATAFSHKGELYVFGSADPRMKQDPDKFYNTAGEEVALPDDFPSDAELKQNLQRTQARVVAQQQPTSPGESGSGKSQENAEREQQRQSPRGQSTVDEDFDSMTKDDLVERTRSQNLDVKRSDGEDGEPLKEDYVKALKRASKAQK